MQLNIQKSVIEIGLDKPIRLLHITDAHMIIDKAEHVDPFEMALAYAKEKDMFVLCTGDNFHGVSEANVAYAKQVMADKNNIFLPGNHDFSRYPDNLGLDNVESLAVYPKEWMGCYKQNLYFHSQIVGGVNFVTLQNMYYSITYGQIQMLQTEALKGYPIVLCMHVPLFTSEKAEEMMATWAPCGYMIAPPEAYYSRYDERRRKEQIATKETLDAVAYIQNEPTIQAIIAGHIHENFDGFADCGKRQICTKPIKEGFAREITIR